MEEGCNLPCDDKDQKNIEESIERGFPFLFESGAPAGTVFETSSPYSGDSSDKENYVYVKRGNTWVEKTYTKGIFPSLISTGRVYEETSSGDLTTWVEKKYTKGLFPIAISTGKIYKETLSGDIIGKRVGFLSDYTLIMFEKRGNEMWIEKNKNMVSTGKVWEKTPSGNVIKKEIGIIFDTTQKYYKRLPKKPINRDKNEKA